VFIPGAGWIGLDPTSGLFASEGHDQLPYTPAPASAAPIEGFTDECEVEFDYSNEVGRVHEDPRVTKPYSDDQWAGILLLGDAVDRDPFEERDTLQARQDIHFPIEPHPTTEQRLAEAEKPESLGLNLLGTAMCIEIRDGKVHLLCRR
jgi:uncharacterized protein (DUF2126 family)